MHKMKGCIIFREKRVSAAIAAQSPASHRLGGRPDLKAAVIVFIGKNKYRILPVETGMLMPAKTTI
ncbi:MAG: hypothetical protein LBB64_07055 [Dysgonamonadaceae bacterium]|jgi:hypothetical protein|nr:hypothetical protein [Dysgonamonadaceae bacterium]